MDATPLTVLVTPQGRLLLTEAADGELVAGDLGARLRRAFDRGDGHGILHLGASEVGAVLPPPLAFFRDLGARFVTALRTRPDIEEARAEASIPPPPPEELEALAAAAPPMTGAEYLSGAVLAARWTDTEAAFRLELSEETGTVEAFLRRRHPAWNLVGRVHFNLAENRRDEAAPFAFVATYTSRLSAQGKAQHLPLGQALREYAGTTDRSRLLSLLLPVQRASETCPWLKTMVDAGEIFHPLRFTPREAMRLLADVDRLEAAGVVVRLPAAWRLGRPSRPRVTATVGGKAPSVLGGNALLDFRVELTVDGEPLTADEVAALLAGSDGLSLIRGQWVEVDRERLRRMMDRFEEARRAAAAGGMSFQEAMRMLAGADVAGDGAGEADPDWSRVVAGPWLSETLRGLRSPAGLARIDPGPELRATLRPYQQVGVRWLYLLSRLGLGACLADDMGLGKTIQVLSLLLVLRAEATGPRRPSLLVAPASLLANWAAEIDRFAPSLAAVVAHPSEMPAGELKDKPASVETADLVITSYGTLLRVPWLTATTFDLAILDEAQAIKNPGARQTRAAKKVLARARIALTGTPVENRVGDLWSIFDFVNPGLLGSAREFAGFTKRLSEGKGQGFGPLRDLVRPYILRRLKTDSSVISDLPAKTEIKAFCQLSRRQAALYQQAVADLAQELSSADGVRRRGVVLASLMRLKQICNHPSQWLGDGAWAEGDSGKFARLREIAEVLAAKQEKALVFTQFREVTAPLEAFLGGVFGRPGLVLHGETEVKKRRDLVRRFEEDERVPFFVLSLKAGGAGLNLTAASHVIHFDRWWNPAVENQATDRAFRIGQKRNVLVHKFVCRGTVEEKIDDLIESKRQLATDLLEGGPDLALTELEDHEILKLVSLDLKAAVEG